ncbi:MAG: hypothetical protein HY289_04385 [Planctomycetes bacterium]|nr:hypothetical protein [Planctomycetota bacterium]
MDVGSPMRFLVLAVLGAFFGGLMLNNLVPPAPHGRSPDVTVNIAGAILGFLIVAGADVVGNSTIRNFVLWSLFGAGIGTMAGFVVYINRVFFLPGGSPPDPITRWQWSICSALMGVVLGLLIATWRLQRMSRPALPESPDASSKTPLPESLDAQQDAQPEITKPQARKSCPSCGQTLNIYALKCLFCKADFP